MKSQRPVILFDGVCSLCHGAVKFCFKYEKKSGPQLHFASLQSDFAKNLLVNNERADDYLGSVLFVDLDGEIYSKSRAVFKIARFLRFPLSLVTYCRVLPVFLTDFFYMLVARSRYRVFGRLEECSLPDVDQSEKGRFLD